jgi:hypothetical protein
MIGVIFRPRIKITGGFLLSLIFFILSFFPSESISQDRYGFDFNKDFDWYDLILSDNVKNSELMKSYVKSLMDEFSIEDGRIFFRELVKLDSINEIKNLPAIIALDDIPDLTAWKSELDSTVQKFNEVNNFSGLINAAYVLSKLRLKEGFSGSSLKKKKYEPNVIPSHTIDIELVYDFFPAECMLDLLDKDSLDGDDICVLDTLVVFSSFYDSTINPDMGKEKFISLLKNVQQKKALMGIYKILNPASFKFLGGVSLHTKSFREILNYLHNRQNYFIEESLYILSSYLPNLISFQTKAYITFGNFVDTIANEENNFTIRLEMVGNDYEKFAPVTARGVFKVIWNDIEIDINKYLVKKEDSLLLNIMDNIYYSSCINYISTQLKEDRPSAMLEKDFAFFNKTVSSVESKAKKSIIDSLIRTGFSGLSPYITMGMQVVNYIDRYLGRESLRNSILLGPVYFFNSYIDMYRQNSSKIRDVFRFNSYFEKKIDEWSSLTNFEIEDGLLKIQRNNSDTSIFFPEIRRLNEKYKTDKFIFNLIAGEMLSKYKYYNHSISFLKKALPFVPNQEALREKINLLEEKINNN